MRILEIETFGRGGLTHYAYNLSEALAARGHDVTLVTTADYELEGHTPPTSRVHVVKPIGRRTSRLRNRFSGLALRLALRAEALADAVTVGRLARRLRPDLVHLHCTNPAAVVYLGALALSGRPVVYTAHVVTPHEKITLQRPIYSSIYRLSDLVVAHSEVDRHRLRDEFDVGSHKVRVIPHGEYGFVERWGELPARATARRKLGLDDDDEVVLFFGYIRRYKGLDVLLDSWPAVAQARPRARLLIAGDPVQLDPATRARFQATARRLNAVCRFAYIPFTDVGYYFGAADLLTMPYRHISQSGVLFLGLSLGLPVVATRVGPLPEMLDDGRTAMLVPPDSSGALADAITRVLGDDDLRQQLADGGRQVAEQHDWASVAERTEAAVQPLANSPHRDTA